MLCPPTRRTSRHQTTDNQNESLKLIFDWIDIKEYTYAARTLDPTTI